MWIVLWERDWKWFQHYSVLSYRQCSTKHLFAYNRHHHHQYHFYPYPFSKHEKTIVKLLLWFCWGFFCEILLLRVIFSSSYANHIQFIQSLKSVSNVMSIVKDMRFSLSDFFGQTVRKIVIRTNFNVQLNCFECFCNVFVYGLLIVCFTRIFELFWILTMNL